MIVSAVIYARYSSAGQTEQSIDGQLRDCYAYAKREKIIILREYIDRAQSGTTDDREQFQNMLKDAEKGDFTQVLVWKLDRFARNRTDSAINKLRLKKCGVKVVSVTEKISEDPEGILMESLLEGLAEYYSANLSKHVKRGHRESALKGKLPNGKPPYGYKLADGRPVVDEERAEVVKYMFEQYAKGERKRVIIKNLRDMGVKGSDGQPFNYHFFDRALKNPRYYGEGFYHDIIIPFPPIISREIFDTVQARLVQHKKSAGQAKAKTFYLLSGKMRCGYCGATMVGNGGKSRNGEKHYYYCCSAKLNQSGCQKKNERRQLLEDYVCEQTMELVLKDRLLQIVEVVAARFAKEHEKDNAEIKKLERAIADAKKIIENCTRSMFSVTTPEFVSAVEKEFTEQSVLLQRLENELLAVKAAASLTVTKEHVTAWFNQFANGDIDDINFRKRLADVFVNSISVYDNRCVIFYNLSAPILPAPPFGGARFGFKKQYMLLKRKYYAKLLKI